VRQQKSSHGDDAHGYYRLDYGIDRFAEAYRLRETTLRNTKISWNRKKEVQKRLSKRRLKTKLAE
jgi:hypothetical protein